MKRENRYAVVKHKDLAAALDAGEVSRSDVLAFHRLCTDLHAWRLDNSKSELVCVVVEDDWPEYEAVWQMIERRVDSVTREPQEDKNADMRDAARYRWLREQCERQKLVIAESGTWELKSWSGDDPDAAIDAAMALPPNKDYNHK